MTAASILLQKDKSLLSQFPAKTGNRPRVAVETRQTTGEKSLQGE